MTEDEVRKIVQEELDKKFSVVLLGSGHAVIAPTCDHNWIQWKEATGGFYWKCASCNIIIYKLPVTSMGTL